MEPILDQCEEYLATPERYEVLGFAGIDGSPSCGVDYTGSSRDYYGSLGGHPDPMSVYATGKLVKRNGVMISVLKDMLEERGLDLPIRGLFAAEPNKIMSFLE